MNSRIFLGLNYPLKNFRQQGCMSEQFVLFALGPSRAALRYCAVEKIMLWKRNDIKKKCRMPSFYAMWLYDYLTNKSRDIVPLKKNYFHNHCPFHFSFSNKKKSKNIRGVEGGGSYGIIVNMEAGVGKSVPVYVLARCFSHTRLYDSKAGFNVIWKLKF